MRPTNAKGVCRDSRPPPTVFGRTACRARPGGIEKGTLVSVEKKLHAKSGWSMLFIVIGLFIAIIGLLLGSIAGMATADAAGLPIPGA